MNPSSNESISIGSHIIIEGFKSEVIGVDHYKISNIEGRKLGWASYTLISEKPYPFDRWWLVFLPNRAPHMFVNSSHKNLDGALVTDLTGLVNLDSDGQAQLSDDFGSLHMFQGANGGLNCVEVFPNCDMLILSGKPIEYLVRD